MTKKVAVEILHKNVQSQNLRRHCYAVGYVMVGINDYLATSEHRMFGSRVDWEVLGILHDADYELTKDDWSKHTVILLEWLKDFGMFEDDPIYLAVMSHNNKITKLRDPQTQMEWALECCDELTGFIVACALVKGGKLSDVTLDTVRKKWSQKSFAKGVIREQIEQCNEKLKISLDDFIEIVLKSMQKNAGELGM